MPPVYQPGDIAIRKNRRDERGSIIGAPQQIAGRYYYRVLFPSSPNPSLVPEADLERVTFGLTVTSRLLNGEYGDRSTLARLLTFERLRRPLQDTLYALRASRTEFQPYQFKPLIKFLRSSKQRLLLADEVGLGKTIEAGFILCEMLARHPHTFRRALIVCKASLCAKWQAELRKRFDLDFSIWRTEQLKEFLRRFREDEHHELRAICSLESFRNSTLAREWEVTPPPLDILIIDEAHHLKNAETKAHKACRTAAESSDAVLALTATPIQIGSRDLFNILSLLDEDEFASFSYFEACMYFNQHIVIAEQKITQQDPDRFKVIEAMLLELANSRGTKLLDMCCDQQRPLPTAEVCFAWNQLCQSFKAHPLFDDTLRLLRTAAPSNRRATIQIQRNLAELNLLSRVFSRTRRRDVHLGTERRAFVKRVEMTEAERGLYKAVLDYVRQRYRAQGRDTALLFGLMMPQRQLASCIPAMVDYYSNEIEDAAGLAGEAADVDAADWDRDEEDDVSARLSQLRELIKTWYREGQPDSKFDVLKQSLQELQESQPGEPVVIFSYFKKTLEYLSRRLGTLGYACTVISGAFSPEERDKRIEQFRTGKYQILLSTEVGSEGLDFQFCHVLFNYDLPWNPMVVEQRIGRLDRFGQKAPTILIFNLSAPGTIEDEILNRLYRRIQLFESYIGDLEAILGSEISTLTKDIFDPELSEAQRLARIERAGTLLEQRKQQFEEWEKASPQFIGHDEYYRQEVDRAQTLGRYIRSEELATLVGDFLVQYDRRSELIQESDGIYRLTAREKLLRFFMDQSEDPQKANLISLLHRGAVRLTFNSDVAERDRNLVFIHVRHFLVRSIVSEYARQEASFHPVARIQLSACDSIRPGTYLYLIHRATIRAAREQEFILPVFVNIDSLIPLEEDAGEICLARMVSEGKDVERHRTNGLRLEPALELAQSTFVDRFLTRRAEIEDSNQAFLEARLASVRESYRLKIKKKNDLLERARAEGRQQSYMRMLEGTIRNLRTELQSREHEMEKYRNVTEESCDFAAGVLFVDEMGKRP